MHNNTKAATLRCLNRNEVLIDNLHTLGTYDLSSHTVRRHKVECVIARMTTVLFVWLFGRHVMYHKQWGQHPVPTIWLLLSNIIHHLLHMISYIIYTQSPRESILVSPKQMPDARCCLSGWAAFGTILDRHKRNTTSLRTRTRQLCRHWVHHKATGAVEFLPEQKPLGP